MGGSIGGTFEEWKGYRGIHIKNEYESEDEANAGS
jgi:hypothetical protein